MSLIEFDNRYFGLGQLLGDFGDKFTQLSWEEKAMALGWSNGCPVVFSLISARGAEVMAKRYGEVNFWFGYIVKQFDSNGLSKYVNELSHPIKRKPWEALGKHDPEWIPQELKDKMCGLGTSLGYTLPRLLLTFIGDHVDPSKHADVERKTNRTMIAMDILDDTIKYCSEGNYSLTDFTVHLTGQLAQYAKLHYGQNPAEYFHQLLGTGKLSEDNCATAYREVIESMKNVPPFLLNEYKALTDQDIKTHHIARLNVDF